jgi:hypothetical protein
MAHRQLTVGGPQTVTELVASPGAPVPAAQPATLTDAALPDVFSFTVEVAMGPNFEWTYFGPNSAVLFGEPLCARTTALDDLLLSRSLQEDVTAAAELLAAAAAGETSEAELRMQGLDGAVRWVQWRIMPRHHGGRLVLDGVATDVSSRRLGRTNHGVLRQHLEHAHGAELVREHARTVRDANDGVLQRIFAAGLRLRMLQRGLDEVSSHAAEAIAFQLEQASADLRQTIRELDALTRRDPGSAA